MGKKKQKAKSDKAEKELELEKSKKKQKAEKAQKAEKKEKKKKLLKAEKVKAEERAREEWAEAKAKAEEQDTAKTEEITLTVLEDNTAAKEEKKGNKPGKTKRSAAVSSDEEMTLLFKALADENRIQIIRLLQENELCAAQLLQALNIVQSTLSHHMKILTESGIISVRRDGKWSRYSINGESSNKMISFLEDLIEERD